MLCPYFVGNFQTIWRLFWVRNGIVVSYFAVLLMVDAIACFGKNSLK
ncbi:MAG: hypothetical protein ABI180_14830 [Microcoleus sp.]|jgi:hypothetical protein